MKFKRTVSLILALILTLSAFGAAPLAASAAGEEPEAVLTDELPKEAQSQELAETGMDDEVAETGLTSSDHPEYTYTKLEDKTVRILRYSGSDTNLTIPSKLDGFTVKETGPSVFSNNNTVKTVILPDTLETIGSFTFTGLKSLTSVKLGKSVKYIGVNAFQYCTSLTKVIMNSSVEEIGSRAFYNCGMLSEINIPDSVRIIGSYAFYDCQNLTVRIPAKLESIDTYAFYNCTLTDIVIPASLTYIGPVAFPTIGVESISVNKNNKVYDSRNGCNAIIKTDENKLILGCKKTVIPDSIEIFGESSLTNYSKEELVFSDSVTRIESGAFYNCRYLTSLDIPDSVTYIGSSAFSGGTKIKKINIGNSVETIGNYAFSNCYSCESLKLGSSVKTIGDYAFSYCEALIEVTIPDGATSIGKNAFKYCKNLTSIHIPESVTQIGDAFGNCNNLTIYGAAGSAAETFANEKGIPFFNVKYTRVASVKLSASSAALTKGKSVQLTATITPSDAFYKTLTWTSSDSYIAHVDQSGRVSGKSPGTAKITVTAVDGASATCTVTVKDNGAAEPEPNLLPESIYDTEESLVKSTYMTATEYGYQRVYFDGKHVAVEKYTDKLTLRSRKLINMELPVWGGFYEGADAYYLIEGQYNKDCVDGTEVIRIIKYSKSWNRLGSGSIISDSTHKIKDGWNEYEIRYPFHYGCVNATELNGTLFIISGRQGYYDPAVGQGHQGMILIKVDESTMESEMYYGNLNHSFAQYIDKVDGNIYTLELSEGDYCTALTKFRPEMNGGYFGKRKIIPVLEYGAQRSSVWAVPVYASVDDMAVSSENILGIGTSIDQSKYSDYDYDTTPYNIYLSVTPVNDFTKEASSLIWLTNYSSPHEISQLKLCKINDNRFMVIWNESDPELYTPDDIMDPLTNKDIHYMFIDSDGKKLGKEYVVKGSLSQCKPLVDGSKIIFTSSENSAVDFYIIDAYTGKFDKRIYRLAGKNAAWDITGDTLSFSGKGEINSYPGFSYNDPDKSIKNIVFKNGITKVSDMILSGLENIETISFEGTLDSVSKFDLLYPEWVDDTHTYYYPSYRKVKDVYVYGDIKNIDEDAFDHFIYATFHVKKGTNIEKYLKEKGLTIKYLSDASCKISGKMTSYLSSTDHVSILLMKDGSVVNNANLTGNSGSYSFDNVKAGTYTVRVSKKNHVTREYKVTVSDKNVTQDVVINPLGDVNSDGKTTNFDYAWAVSYCRKEKTLTDYQIKCGDVFGSGDGKLKMADAARINQHVRKEKKLY